MVLPKGNDITSGTVKSRVKDYEGQPIGRADKNRILDTRVYNVEFSDGKVAELGANIIAECMYAQCDIEGNQYRLMDHIVDHRKDGQAASKHDQEVTSGDKTYKHCRVLGLTAFEFSSSIRQLVGLGGLFCQLNGPEQESLVTMI